jgi:hypothetical protein
MKYFIYFFFIVACTGCSVVSRQAYYVPAAPHQTTKDRAGYFKVVRSRMGISDTSGKNIGEITTSNGIGTPLLVGPPYLPVLPVGIASLAYSLHKGGENHFVIDVDIRCNNGYFMPLAIDSNNYKKTRDSLSRLNIATAVRSNTSDCYMIINNSVKVPLKMKEFYMGNGQGHSYRMFADIPFSKVNTMRLVTGNPLIDNSLKDVTFKRRHRLAYCVIKQS